MTWYDRIEQYKTLLISGITAISICILGLASLRNPVSFDSFWHLQTGLDWIQKGLSPWVDHYSFTHAGMPISNQPVIFQTILAFSVETLGLEAGFRATKFAAFLMAIGLMTFFLRRLKSPAIIYLLILPLLALLIELRAIVRPELFAYSLSIIAVMLYHRARGRVTMANMLPIALLMFVWANYHTPTLGYILFFGFFVDAAFLQIREKVDAKAWAKWLIYGLFVLSVGTLNKGFHTPVIGAISFSSEYVNFIQEYQSASILRNIVGIYSMAAVVLAVLFLAVKQGKFGVVVVTLIFTYHSINMVRLVTPCGIIILGLLASLISEVDLKALIERQSKLLRQFSGFGVLVIVLMSLYSSVTLARDFMRENKTSSLNRPEAIVAYMQEAQISGHIFNEYGRGGYLIYSLTPDVKVYIDGRTGILYNPTHLNKFEDALANPVVLREEIEKYNINLALLESDRRTYSVLQETGALGLDFADHKFSLFTRDKPNFPVTGQLLGNPACWNENQREQLETEFESAVLDLPGNSSILPILAFMLNYSRQRDKPGFLREFAEADIEDEMLLRFAAYQALSLGLYEVSADLFERIEVWEYREFLFAALANKNLERWEKFEEVISSMTSFQWPYVSASDKSLLYWILETSREQTSLSSVSDMYMINLGDTVNKSGISVSNLDYYLKFTCTPSNS